MIVIMPVDPADGSVESAKGPSGKGKEFRPEIQMWDSPMYLKRYGLTGDLFTQFITCCVCHSAPYLECSREQDRHGDYSR